MAVLQWHTVYKHGEDELHRAPVVALTFSHATNGHLIQLWVVNCIISDCIMDSTNCKCCYGTNLCRLVTQLVWLHCTVVTKCGFHHGTYQTKLLPRLVLNGLGKGYYTKNCFKKSGFRCFVFFFCFFFCFFFSKFRLQSSFKITFKVVFFLMGL